MCRLSYELMSSLPSMKRRSKPLAKVQGTSKLGVLQVLSMAPRSKQCICRLLTADSQPIQRQASQQQ